MKLKLFDLKDWIQNKNKYDVFTREGNKVIELIYYPQVTEYFRCLSGLICKDKETILETWNFDGRFVDFHSNGTYFDADDLMLKDKS